MGSLDLLTGIWWLPADLSYHSKVVLFWSAPESISPLQAQSLPPAALGPSLSTYNAASSHYGSAQKSTPSSFPQNSLSLNKRHRDKEHNWLSICGWRSILASIISEAAIWACWLDLVNHKLVSEGCPEHLHVLLRQSYPNLQPGLSRAVIAQLFFTVFRVVKADSSCWQRRSLRKELSAGKGTTWGLGQCSG